MRVCIDGFAVNKLSGTGLYAYTFDMINNLLKMYPQPKYYLVWDENIKIPLWNKYRNIKYINIELDRTKNNFIKLEDFLIKNKINIYHSPNNGFSIPNKKICKNIITVHDLIAVSNEKYTDEKYKRKFNEVFPQVLEKSDKIIAVSNFIKNELTNNFNINQEKIKVIYPGCSSIFNKIEYNESKVFLREKYKIKNDYLLFIGSIHVRKNINILLEVFKEILKYNKDLDLVIVGKINGKREEYYSKIKTFANELNINNNIIFTGLVEFQDVPYFYNSCICVINLSEYEGFPLSTVEAMSCNKPVICCKSSCFDEVIGQSSFVVNPKDKNLIKDIILELINNKEYYKKVEKRVKIQANKFNRNTSIKELVSVYESII